MNRFWIGSLITLFFIGIGSFGFVAAQSSSETFYSIADSMLSEDQPTVNFGGRVLCEIDGSDPGNSGHDLSTVIRFDLSGASGQVETAQIVVNMTNGSDDFYNVYELKRPFVESEATWQQAANGDAWEVPGANGPTDRASSPLGQVGGRNLGQNTIDIPAVLVQSWLDNPTTNYGVIIANSVPSNGIDIDCREIGGSLRPALIINYVAGPTPIPTNTSIPTLIPTSIDIPILTNTPTNTPIPTDTPVPPTNTPTPIPPGQVGFVAETNPVPEAGDIADDPAIWLHPTDAGQSVIIGTNKSDTNGGLHLYNLNGTEFLFVQIGKANNVDLRGNLVMVNNRTNNTIVIFRMNSSTRQLEPAGSIQSGIDVYGLCMYTSPWTGKMYALANSKLGEVEQWELTGNPITGTLVRTFDVGGQVEGCVADDHYGWLYIGEENVGIWRYSAEPTDGTDRYQVDSTAGNLTADVEGLAIYYNLNRGYLVASSQGSSDFTVYKRGCSAVCNKYLGRFSVTEVEGTDGIDVINTILPGYPGGLFVVQDGINTPNNQNFKMVAWQDIINAIGN